MFSDGGGTMFGGGFMWLIWILLIVAVVLVVKAWLGGSSGSASPVNESPMEILKKRYALGEIDEEEFERRRRELER